MNFLTVEGLTKIYGEKVLFENLSFHINQGQKVALVAPNGTGKTSLLRCIAGTESPDAGSSLINKDVQVAFLEQEPDLNPEHGVYDAVFDGSNPTLSAIRNYENCMKHGASDEDVQAAFNEMESLGAWDYETRVKTIISKLQLDDIEQKIGLLSGGQQKRVALAKVLIQEPDFLILDEPTNHLDLKMIEWLETYLAGSKLTLFMITHDRYFLENVCSEILELDEGQLYKHRGNFSTYLENKDIRRATQSATIDKAKNLMRTELEWVRRMPKARGTKNKARLDAFVELKQTATKRLRDDKVELEFKGRRLGSKIVEFHHVHKSFGELKILVDFNYKFQRYERVGIVGPNGVGKSTLLNMLTEQEAVDSGKIIVGETVAIGYFDQKGLSFDKDRKVIDVIRDIADYIPLNKGRMLTAEQLLERFLFTRDQQHNYVRKLSGGERRKLYLCTVLMQNPNFLILDEPTNDLDIMTLSVLEDFLLDFPGNVFVVSHDRYFMDKIVEHLFVFEGQGKVSDFPGTYTQWRARQDELTKAAHQEKTERAPQAPKEQKNTKAKKKLSYKEQQEFNGLEAAIEELESKKETLTQQLSDGSLQGDEFMKVSQELGEVVASLEQKTERWFELAAFA